MTTQPELFAMPTDKPATLRGRQDAARAANERELLWPPSVMHLSAKTRTMLFGDIPAETRLNVKQVCRRLGCDSNTVHRHIHSGNLVAANIATGSDRPCYRVYRWSLVEMLYKQIEGDWSA